MTARKNTSPALLVSGSHLLAWPSPACCFLFCLQLVPPRPCSASGATLLVALPGGRQLCVKLPHALTHSRPAALGPTGLPEGGSWWASCPPQFPKKKNVSKGRLHTQGQGYQPVSVRRGRSIVDAFSVLKYWMEFKDSVTYTSINWSGSFQPFSSLGTHKWITVTAALPEIYFLPI